MLLLLNALTTKDFMKIYSILLGVLSFCTLSAETIQNIEYRLPTSAQNWQAGNKIENDKGTTIIYIPQGADKTNAKEFFGANSNRYSDSRDPSEMLLMLQKMYPNMTVDYHAVEQTPEGMIYEWSAKENNAEKIHSIGRTFSNSDGTVVLSYQTEDIDNLPQSRSIWLATLKEAKQLNK